MKDMQGFIPRRRTDTDARSGIPIDMRAKFADAKVIEVAEVADVAAAS